MNVDKMSSDIVAENFTEWLLSMGCPGDIIPSQDNMAKMCRGQYHLVWRSLMEKVDARNVVREKRLQVFCDDVRRCKNKNALNEHSTSVVVPEQLSLWKEQVELKKKVEDTKARVMIARRDLDHVIDGVSSKAAQCSISRKSVEDASRRAWFLKQVAAELQAKKTNLQETRTIADSLCSSRDDDDVQSKVERCLSTFRRQSSVSQCSYNTTWSDELEARIGEAARSRGEALATALLHRRAALPSALSATSNNHQTHKMTPQAVVAMTAALHCTLALEATKNKIHLKQARKKLLETVTQLSNHLSGESCELLVVRCERAHKSGRAASLRAAPAHLAALCQTHSPPAPPSAPAPAPPPTRTIHQLNKDIESKRDELMCVISSLANTEHKIQYLRDCLRAIFDAFTSRANTGEPCTDVQLDLPPESIASLREYYEQRRETNKRRVELSMELDVSEKSLTELIDFNNPKFVDELKIYLKKFSLEKNRQLVLERSGEKIWTFETVPSSARRLHAAWSSCDVPSAPLCAGDGVTRAVRQCALTLTQHLQAEEALRALQTRIHIPVIVIDISAQKEEEQKITDRTKKRLRANLLEVQKIEKTFVLVQEDLKYWSDNNAKKYISPARQHNGMTYRDYEVYYIDNCVNV